MENHANWVWFCSLLRDSIEKVVDICIPLISDCQKGLLRAVSEVFPSSIHSHCAFYIRRNVKKAFGKAAEQFF